MHDASTSSASSASIAVATVRQLFARPIRCDASQFLRREISARMLERLPLIKIQPQQILDAGCGEGRDLFALQQHYPAAALLGIDAAAPMLQAARSANAATRSALKVFLSNLIGKPRLESAAALLGCADFAQLPVASNRIDLLWSNLALHWHPQPHLVLAEWARVLRTDGLLMFSCFGPDTFAELRELFQAQGMPSRVLPFVDLHDYGDMLQAAGMADPVMDMEKITLTYADPAALLADVRAFGGNPLRARARGLQGQHGWRGVLASLDQRRDNDGRISLTV
ncbi:MAG: methyltransferase domain-containing protein, partial [Betaproteobacteria bacterium]